MLMLLLSISSLQSVHELGLTVMHAFNISHDNLT